LALRSEGSCPICLPGVLAVLVDAAPIATVASWRGQRQRLAPDHVPLRQRFAAAVSEGGSAELLSQTPGISRRHRTPSGSKARSTMPPNS
jgi:hypothetical protein